MASRDAQGAARRAASVRGSNQRNEEGIRVCSFLSVGALYKMSKDCGLITKKWWAFLQNV